MERKKPLRRTRMATIRALRPDEPIPDVEPKRYRNGDGYVRLRWLVAPQTYVEELEHRIVAGRPHPRFDVHHINGDKSDNRPENLQVLTRSEHAALHGAERERTYAPHRSRSAKDRAERAEANRQKRAARRVRIRELYEDEGLTTVEVARLLGLDNSTVSRELRSAGGTARRTGPSGRMRQLVQARARMRCERCGTDLRWEPHQIHHRQPRKMGGTSRPEANAAYNLLLLCLRCHAHVEANRAEAYEFGWLVREPTDPATVPVLLVDGWATLEDLP